MSHLFCVVDDRNVVIGVFTDVEIAKRTCIDMLSQSCPLDTFGEPKYEIDQYIANEIPSQSSVVWHTGLLDHTVEQYLEVTGEAGLFDFESLYKKYKIFTSKTKDLPIIDRDSFFQQLVEIYGAPEEHCAHMYYWDLY